MKIRAALVTAAAAVLAAGCGSDSSRRGSGASAQDPASSRLASYAHCMRSHGVPDFPDPVNGRLMLRQGAGGDLDPASASFRSAQQACRSLAPAGTQAGSGASGQLQAKALKFARCMRRHGVPDFPDPAAAGGGVQVQIPAGVDPQSPQFQKAQRACRSLSVLPGGTQ